MEDNQESSITSPVSGAPATIQTSDVTSPPPASEGERQRRHQRTDPSSPFSSRVFSPPDANPLPSSEIDLSSPLTYGTPSSRGGGPGSNRGATPIRPRSDIGQSQRLREINVGISDPASGDPTSRAGLTSESGADAHLVVWGTDVNISETKRQFKLFLRQFVNDLHDDDDDQAQLQDRMEPFYMTRLEEINCLEEPFLNVNATHLHQFNPDLYSHLVRYPQEVIPTFDLVTNELFNELYPDSNLPHQIQVRAYNAERTKNMRSLNPEDIDQLITISGMVIRSSPIVPEMREAFFQCYICHATQSVVIDRGRIAEPAVCSNCEALYSMTLIHNRSYFTDKQVIKLQESPEDMPAGQTPHTVILYAHHDLVDKVQPGDRIVVTGIYRAVPLRVNPRARTVKSVYKTYIDVIHYKKTDSRRLRERENEEDEDDHRKLFTPERVEQLIDLSRTPDIYERLAHALAPSIYENEDIKKGILLQLFGGTRKDFKNAGRGHFRAEVNILLCGDPGTSKSQLLQLFTCGGGKIEWHVLFGALGLHVQLNFSASLSGDQAIINEYVHNLMPRGQYTSGKGSSAVGLTAYVTKDPDTNQLVLQTGALVLSDNGICCIDEFDKMNDNTRSVLHEVMEQQTLSIAKAGIICSLNARASILAAANPRMSSWDEKSTVVENIQLPHTLLSRFDLIFLMLDPQDEQFDRRLATHLVSLYHQTRDEEESAYMDMATLRDYIGYARKFIHPSLSEEAGQTLVDAYVSMRKVGSSHGAVSAYPRQLESLIRLAEAHAKMRFSKTVEIVDVEEAKRLHKEALKQAATDPKTGIIDVGILTTGVSSSERQRRETLAKELRKILQSKCRGGAPLKQLEMFEVMKEQSQSLITQQLFEAALKLLQDEDFCTVSSGTIRLST